MLRAKLLSSLALASLVLALQALPAAAQTRHPPAKHPPAKPKADTYHIMEFVIGTGGDDLRGDSAAWATVAPPVGKRTTCGLKEFNQDSWGNGSTHKVTCQLAKPLTLAQFQRTRVTIAYYGEPSSFGETQDNWNMSAVTIYVYNESTPPICVFMASGSPLHRFQGVHPQGFGKADDSVVVTNFPNHC